MDDTTRELVNNIDPIVWARIEALSDWYHRLGTTDWEQIRQLLLHIEATCQDLEGQDE